MMSDIHVSHLTLRRVFNGEDVSPLYYVAVIRYLVNRLHDDSEVTEFFQVLQRLFSTSLHPPNCHLLAVWYPRNLKLGTLET